MNINKEKVKEIQKDATQLLNQVWLKYGLRKSENWKDSYQCALREVNREIVMLDYNLNLYSVPELKSQKEKELNKSRAEYSLALRNSISTLSNNSVDEKAKIRLAYLHFIGAFTKILIEKFLNGDQ
jgi:hypothetical protein